MKGAAFGINIWQTFSNNKTKTVRVTENTKGFVVALNLDHLFLSSNFEILYQIMS